MGAFPRHEIQDLLVDALILALAADVVEVPALRPKASAQTLFEGSVLHGTATGR